MIAKIGRTVFGILVVGAALVAVPSTAAAQSQQTTTPFAQSLFNPCTGEIVDISGTTTTTMNQRVDSRGGIHISFASVTKGTGIGQSTGVNYPYNENDMFSLQAGSATESTVRVKNRLKGPGSIDNWDLTFLLHVTLNADGTLTSFTDTFATNCRG